MSLVEHHAELYPVRAPLGGRGWVPLPHGRYPRRVTQTAAVPSGVTPSREARAHLVIDRVSKTFEGRDASVEALREISFAMAENEFITLIGPSGCGKSTLLRIVGGLIPPTSGRVEMRGRSPEDAQKAKDIGFVFQQPALLPWRTVADNVELPFALNKGAGGDRRLGTTDELLALVGLSQFAKAHPYQLSGGMQQRVAIARALIFDPSLLLMDEPFGALDEITRDGMRYELLRIWSRAKKTVLFVTHSIAEAIVLSDRVVVMSKRPGEVREVIRIELPRPRGEEIESTTEFIAYAARLRRLLHA
jgi:NitT/TauT family transport system ATP-binding protein